MNILFFISHQPNPRFVKQINFLARKHEVSLVFFHRETLANLNDSIEKNVTIHNLGGVPNASQPFKRIWVYIKAIKKIRKIIKKAKFDVALVNNIDVIILYLMANFKFGRRKHKPKLTIEISDLREFVFSDSFVSKRMRALEKYLYKKYIDKLIVTSKKYYTYHFEKFFKKEVFVLENKLLSVEQKNDPNIQKKQGGKTVIGIVGLLLRKDEYVKLFETYKDHPEVDIHIHGKGHYQHIVEEYAAKHTNITYFGPYNTFTDAQRIYNSIDIIYLVYDIDQVSLNNRLALPNKLYECMYYKVPLICSKETYLEEIVMDLGIGISINYKEPNAIQDAVSYLSSNSDRLQNNFSSLSQNTYFGDQDYEELEIFLAN
ncbi:glycosyltransferase involved in cell wall biosynthesis [Kordia periserrulae]|uniref:Glycosyltransferase involved in cell wall biosynthesis n=1 Tax=Kordia periserrulae TaxID=701523 RepID=A0A2T6BWH7_9FLAO|nr:glycosyltransferase [Kordia periserrulae]PTX60431.1 glycosyltransferase involved in cell wall biosynthesis [Kordia periserrulae]